MFNSDLRHRLLKFPCRIVGHECVEKSQDLEMVHTVETRQAGIRDLRAIERQILEICQTIEMRETDVGDSGPAEIERLELGERLQVRQSGVLDPGVAER
jgi:hypothetical protein